MATIYYVSHPQVQIDAAVPVPRWGLSAVGRARMLALSDAAWVKSLVAVHTSDETKAVETAEMLANFAGCSLSVHAGMGENDRSATGFLPPPEFEATADAFFANPATSVRGWERAVDAQSRIVAAIERVVAAHTGGGSLAFCGHGAVGTLAFCHYAGEPIRRVHDQPAGGGNVFALGLTTRRPLFAWTPLEKVPALLHKP